jgi:hypothetical protein
MKSPRSTGAEQQAKLSLAARRAHETRRREIMSERLDPKNAIEVAVVRASRGALARARSNGLQYDVDLPGVMLQACRLQGARCGLSGVPFSLEVIGAGAAPRPFSPSVDRISSAAGYTTANCRLVAWAVNCFCGVWGAPEAIQLARGMVEVVEGADRGTRSNSAPMAEGASLA